MVTIELRFLSGRFHATPWGRHVNEGAPEWPPSPYRLIRALVDAWHRKRSSWKVERVLPILGSLSGEAPRFALPPATASHTRAYLSLNTKDVTNKARVFDAFVVVDPSDPVVISWPNARLTDAQRADLSELLANVNYLGRSESWVELSLSDGSPPNPNCWPSEDLSPGDREIVVVACPMAHDGIAAGEGDWLSALGWTTAQLVKARRSEPPALRLVPYLRPTDCFAPAVRTRRRHPAPRVHGVLYALRSRVPPRVLESLHLAERVRAKLMGIHRRLVGDPAKVSLRFSGKDRSGRPLAGHRHVFILPLDRDRDGRLDHLLVYAKDPLDEIECVALDELRSVWQGGGKPDLALLPILWAELQQLLSPSSVFASATPFVPTRHYRRGRGTYEEWLVSELQREAMHHDLPPIAAIEPMAGYPTPGRRLRWVEFRSRRKDDRQRRVHGFRLTFEREVLGPFALGYGAHFGLGLFVPSSGGSQTQVRPKPATVSPPDPPGPPGSFWNFD